MLYDKDLREPLFDYLEGYFGKVRILEEKQIGKSRADIVMVMEKALVGIEIKSDADTYARLAGQVKDYDLFFDYNIVVTGTTHGIHIKEHVPEWWGIITAEEADNSIDFYMYRKMQANKGVSLKKQLSLLWRPELAHIQNLNGMAKYKEKSKKFVIEKIGEKIPAEILKPQMSEELFERDYNLIAEQIREFRVQESRNALRIRKKSSW
ncbi:hypothetical protein C3B58_06740 [Lactonifactor longoviformis]|uniref:Sce7726 family protein n=1 Tax=Lactonifactor longoviformis DSM 17459 TaxID=1122155 RepID=A0A1M5AT45_9CLOT|nr:sce7726 family protein [Lactonifactor longoviformis]POP33579.1 hypothetical protein C3B58_06740 [Lactonifactor longoviformis]SHF33409.1 hypothetical protein SAMN02745158_03320 [Lactonifactor longoviformis DSM 17459]